MNPDELPQELSENEIIEQLAGLNYGPRDIAVYLGVDTKAFMEAWRNPETDVRECYDRGRLKAQADVNMQLLHNAQTGNITAAQMYEKNRAQIQLDNLREQIFFSE
jgi:hypothetical protein